MYSSMSMGAGLAAHTTIVGASPGMAVGVPALQTGDTLCAFVLSCAASITICSKVADWQPLDPLPGPSPRAAALLSSLSLGRILCRCQLCCQVLNRKG